MGIVEFAEECEKTVTFEHEVATDLQSIIDLLVGITKRLDEVIECLSRKSSVG